MSSHALGDPLLMMISNFNLQSFPLFRKADDFSTKKTEKTFYGFATPRYLLLGIPHLQLHPDPVGTSSALQECIARLFSLAPACCSAGAPGGETTKIRPKKDPGHPGKHLRYAVCSQSPSKQNAVGSSTFQQSLFFCLVRHEISSKVTRKYGKASWALKIGTENADIGMPSSHVKHCHVRNLGNPRIAMTPHIM